MSFRLIFELEPPRVPDLKKVRRQIEVFGPIVDAILVPDNHVGRPAVSSLAIALEVRNHGFKPIVCMNARDRNMLRLESDLLTLRAYEIEEVLLVPGDKVEGETPKLNVRTMLEHEAGEGISKGVLARVGMPIGWRDRADWLLTKLGAADPTPWRKEHRLTHPLYAAVIAFRDKEMAKRIVNNIPDLSMPDTFFDEFDARDDYGFTSAIAELDKLHANGIDGAQLVVPTGRRRFAELLEDWIIERKIRG